MNLLVANRIRRSVFELTRDMGVSVTFQQNSHSISITGPHDQCMAVVALAIKTAVWLPVQNQTLSEFIDRVTSFIPCDNSFVWSIS